MIQIQQATIEANCDDKNFHSEDWKTFVEGDTAEEVLTGLVRIINGEELDDVNNWFRVVNANTKEVL